MNRRTRHSTRLQALDSDPDSAGEDPTFLEDCWNLAPKLLEQLRHVATEIIEGAAASRFQDSDREDLQDDEGENQAGIQTESMIAIESSNDSDGAGGCGGTPTGIVRERLSWQPMQIFEEPSKTWNFLFHDWFLYEFHIGQAVFG